MALPQTWRAWRHTIFNPFFPYVFETHTDLQATLQMQGRGLEVSDLILGCPELRDERDKGRGYFFA